MAQNITLMGASYSDVPGVELPKTGGGLALFTDVTDTTATAADVASGAVFYAANGVRTLGTGSGGDCVFIAEYGTTTYAEITAALAAGKAVFAEDTTESIILPYVCKVSSNNSYAFSCMIGNTRWTFYCSTSSAWTTSSKSFDDFVEKGNGGNYNASGSNYRVFFRIPKNTSTTACTSEFIVGNFGSMTAATQGLYLVEINNRSSAFTVRISQLIKTGASGFKFGWYESDGYYYLGVYTTTGYSGAPKAVLLTTGSTSYPIEFGSFVSSSTKPTGWTDLSITNTVATTDELTPYDDSSYASATSISSLADLKTQLSTWYADVPNNTARTFYITVSGTWSPFASGSGIIVVVERAATNGTASFYGRTASAPVMARMVYVSSAWSGFSVMATTDDINTAIGSAILASY